MIEISKIVEAITISLHVSFVSTLFAFLISVFLGYFIGTNHFFLKSFL